MTSQIDLSKYVGKKVRVTFNNKSTQEVFISLGDNSLYPYKIGSRLFDKHGRVNFITNSGDIIHIEELQMNNYQELENKVKEMQAEIDRLKAKDKKEVPKIKCIEVTRTIVYDPECYLKYCLNKKVRPSQSGFVYYMKACFDDNFALSDYYEQEIKELEVWNED